MDARTTRVLAAATHAAEERAQALEALTTRMERGESDHDGGSRRGKNLTAELHKLESRLQSLTISEAGAISRAEAAERVLDDAMNGRQELAERLQVVEQPVAELTERLLQAEGELDAAKAQLAALNAEVASATHAAAEAAGSGADGVGTPSGRRAPDGRMSKEGLKDEVTRLKREMEAAKEEAQRAREFEAIATMQVSDLSSRQGGYEAECAALREALTQLQASGDEQVETGKLQWEKLQARRAEGEARRREAAAIARRNHVQSALFRLQVPPQRPRTRVLLPHRR